MVVKRLVLQNFRTYENTVLDFKTRLVFFIGENGEGKSNLLEAFSILSSLKSFRGNTDDEVLQWDKNHYFIACLMSEQEEDSKLEIGFEVQPRRRKKIKLNGDQFRRQSDAFGILPCVVLSPVDMEIIEGSHAERRKFVDQLSSYLSNDYLNHLNEYNRLIKQRNASLKNNNINPDLLLVWDKMLCEKDHLIREFRKSIIEELNHLFRNNLNLLSGSKDNFQLDYIPNVSSQEEYRIKIRESFQKDIRVGYSTVGCHRDEIRIGTQGKDLQSFASQGQKRSSVISLKTASFELIRRKINKDPILLIDDVIRELDVKRRQFFVDLIRECGQAFFTTTDLEGIHDYIGNMDEPKQIFEIASGNYKEI